MNILDPLLFPFLGVWFEIRYRSLICFKEWLFWVAFDSLFYTKAKQRLCMWRFFLSLEDRHCSLESDKTGSRALKQKLITLVRIRRKNKVSSFYQILLFMGFFIISAKIALLEFQSVLHPTIFVFTGNGSKYSLIILWTFFQMVFSVESVDPWKLLTVLRTLACQIMVGTGHILTAMVV